jgi:hypothetical protein
MLVMQDEITYEASGDKIDIDVHGVFELHQVDG